LDLTFFQLADYISYTMDARPKFNAIWQELSSHKSLVLLSGPRQSGKTYFSQNIVSASYANHEYFNYDEPGNKERLLRDPLFFQNLNRTDATKPLIVFDEIHKFHDWKNYLKGVYDRLGAEFAFLVTGSGRLEAYQKGGDSLAGRYLPMRFWPITVGESLCPRTSPKEFLDDPARVPASLGQAAGRELWRSLEQLSGFPEPLFSGDQRHYTRWSATYNRQLIQEDVREILNTGMIDKVALLSSLLPRRIGSPLSQNSLAEDLSVSPNTVALWLSVFERLMLTLSLSPWHQSVNRTVKKEKKLYLYDFGRIPEPGARFENMIAVELSRAVSCWNDLGYGEYALHYLRNKESQEVDFLVADRHQPLFMVEAKSGAEEVPPNVLAFQKQLRIPAIVLTAKENTCRTRTYDSGPVLLVSAWDFCAQLP
jgi:predicted AAA+ superfamily ATPase